MAVRGSATWRGLPLDDGITMDTGLGEPTYIEG